MTVTCRATAVNRSRATTTVPTTAIWFCSLGGRIASPFVANVAVIRASGHYDTVFPALASTMVRQVIVQVPLLFVFCLVMAVVNLVVTFALGKLPRLNLEDVALAVNASLGGPTSAAAMAIAMGWSKLVLPALLVGIWGYAIGTAVGLAVGETLRAWL